MVKIYYRPVNILGSFKSQQFFTNIVAASVCYLLDVLRNTKFKPDILAYRRAKLEGSQ